MPFTGPIVVAKPQAAASKPAFLSALGATLNTDAVWQPAGLGATTNVTTYLASALGATLNTDNYPPGS